MDYAVKYSPKVDERFHLGALTEGVKNDNYDWIGVQTVYVYSIPTVAMNDYTASGTSRYGTPSELDNEAQEMQITQDRSFTFTIDRKNHDDTMMVMEAGRALARQIEEVVIPEIDTYRITKLAAGASTTVTAALTTSTAYAGFLAVQEAIDELKAPQAGRVCLATPAFVNLIKQDEAFIKRGDLATQIAINGMIGEIDGVPVVKVPSSYFPENTDFIITNPAAMVAPVKLQEYKIHENAPGISGWLVEGRLRYDAFVLNEKADAIGVHKNA